MKVRPATDVVRAFLAIEIDEEVRRRLVDATDPMRALDARIRWVSPECIHLTLLFLGCIPQASLPDIAGPVRDVASGLPRFSFRIAGLGFFGPARAPRVLWAGLPEPPAGLLSLQRQIADRLRHTGFAEDTGAYMPHVTLGRVRTVRDLPALVRALEAAAATPFGTMTARHVSLMRSILEPQGVRYEPLGEFPLAPPDSP